MKRRPEADILDPDDDRPIDEDIRIPFVRRGFFVYPVAVIVVVGFLIMALSRSIFVYVLPGEIGVRYDPFLGGTQTDVYGEGLVVKLPWDRFYTYEIRLQNSRHNMRALSSEGMSFDIEISVLYRPKADVLGELHQELGPNYRERVIEPIVVSTVREVFSRHTSHAVYSTDFSIFQGEIAAKLDDTAVRDLVEFTSVLIMRLEMPDIVRLAINRKLEQEQIAESYDFILASQRAEAERKRIEAIGVQNFYSIVASSLSEDVLTWQGIEATVKLASSDNAKMVVIGSGEGQLPIILGGEIGALPPGPPPQIVPVPEDTGNLDFDRLAPLFPDANHTLRELAPTGLDITAPTGTIFTPDRPSDGEVRMPEDGNLIPPWALVPNEAGLPRPTEVERN
ncbi:prohibitin family protein [Meridianimarinicoccus aquatilis]|uniref:Prohibitin family protein n=1 Tax=Meridianimarinicoccus aquatilis TaxID=2552766 RepID=A0A4R6AVN9_9RHOB|nr:prohibitin family protein [Fluviibacterium aquatile]TDL86316.1 prohibitin family protein [Fluviibacterium aquatile]